MQRVKIKVMDPVVWSVKQKTAAVELLGGRVVGLEAHGHWRDCSKYENPIFGCEFTVAIEHGRYTTHMDGSYFRVKPDLEPSDGRKGFIVLVVEFE